MCKIYNRKAELMIDALRAKCAATQMAIAFFFIILLHTFRFLDGSM